MPGLGCSNAAFWGRLGRQSPSLLAHEEPSRVADEGWPFANASSLPCSVLHTSAHAASATFLLIDVRQHVTSANFETVYQQNSDDTLGFDAVLFPWFRQWHVVTSQSQCHPINDRLCEIAPPFLHSVPAHNGHHKLCGSRYWAACSNGVLPLTLLPNCCGLLTEVPRGPLPRWWWQALLSPRCAASMVVASVASPRSAA